MVNTDRIRQLSHCAADGKWSEFYMSIPPRPDRDADLVLSAAADEIDRLRAENAALKCRPSSESPGVQGLAQLGRNCIDRVIELEGQVGNLAMLISRLARQLDPSNPKHETVCKAAFEYLRKINRTPGIMREEM